jgi:glycosyltransferase involved in cell wall biosynthesis
MTSYTESFGIVLIEAMSHGVPCIAFDSAEGAREIISSGFNGYLIKNRNSVEYVRKCEQLMDDIEKRKKIGKAGKESVKKYSVDVVKKDWYKLLEK